MTRESATSSRVLAGKYQLLHRLGQGGMGSVWLASHLTLHSPVAIKLMDPAIATNPEALARFLREARAAATLRSPHVVQILDHGVDGATPYIAMELLEGESLADRLRRLGQLPPVATARVMTHISRAVARAHEAGIVHRDLKPHNIFLVENDDEEMAKVLDFGIAKTTLDGLGPSVVAETRTGALMGTLHYMSPEQAEGMKTVDFRTDIWAMGVIAYECLLGKRPFEGETVGMMVLAICSREPPIPSAEGKVPAGFDRWFARTCARAPHERWPSARDAAAELRRLCEAPADATRKGRAAALAPTMLPREAAVSATRRRGRLIAAAIGGALVVVGAVAALTRQRVPETVAPVSAPISPASAAVPPPTPLPPPPPAPAVVAPEPPAPAAAAVAPETPAAKPSPSHRRRSAKPEPRPAPAEPGVNLGI